MFHPILCFFGRHSWRREYVYAGAHFPKIMRSPGAPTCHRCRHCGAVKEPQP